MKWNPLKAAARLALAVTVVSLTAGGWLLACTNNPSSPKTANPEGPAPTLTALPATGDPMTADVLTSPEWQKAAWTALTPATKETRRIPATRVASLYDAERLYIAFVGVDVDRAVSTTSIWLDISAAQNGTEVYEITSNLRVRPDAASTLSHVWHRCVLPPERRDTPDYALPMSHIKPARPAGLSVRTTPATIDGHDGWISVYSIHVSALPLQTKGAIRPGETNWKVNLIRQDVVTDPRDPTQSDLLQTNLSPVYAGAQAVMPYRMASLVLATRVQGPVARDPRNRRPRRDRISGGTIPRNEAGVMWAQRITIRAGTLALASILALAGVSSAPGAPASAPATAPRRAPTFDLWVQARIKSALDQAEADGDFAAAQDSILKTFDAVLGYGTEKNLAAFRDAAFAMRLVTQLETVEDNVATLKFLRRNEQLARTLCMLMTPEDDPQKVFAMLARLRVGNERNLETFAQLAAAVCVVHDRPMIRRVNENKMTSPDPVAIFEYYIANEKAMFFGIRKVPAELLIWVVDTTTPIAEMTWALQRYGRDDMVGKHFFDIKYDEDHFRKGTPKKVDLAGYSITNILKHGGICADQAYFAIEVGKAIGVPTAYASGASAESPHAWVGFLQARGGRGWWNFDVGRYEEYKGVRGWVLDPQTRGKIPDNYVSLAGEMIGSGDVDREIAGAMTDAASRLVLLVSKNAAFNPDPPEIAYVDILKRPRRPTAETILELLEVGLKKNNGYARGWLTVRDLAAEGKMTLDQKKRWSDIVLKLCGQKYPDFALEILGPMIGTVADVKEQDRLWNAAFNLFLSRPDIAAEVRMAQARMWLDHKDPNAAGLCFMDVINRFSNAGPFVLPALEGAEALLRETGKANKVVQLYADTWKRITKPTDMAGPFMSQSNWYKVGKLLAAKMREAGDEKGAANVMAALANSTK